MLNGKSTKSNSKSHSNDLLQVFFVDFDLNIYTKRRSHPECYAKKNSFMEVEYLPETLFLHNTKMKLLLMLNGRIQFTQSHRLLQFNDANK